MTLAYASFPRRRPLAGIGVSLAFHALLVALWQLSPSSSPDDNRHSSSMELLLLPPPQPEPAASTPVPATPAMPAPRSSMPRAQPATSPSRGQVQEEPVQAPIESGIEGAPAAPTPEGSLLDRARAAAGGVDRGLRQENPRRGIEAPVESRQTKLEKGIARAAEMAPNRWYQAPKIKEIIDPGGYGRKRYRVVGAAGTYCVTYESNHAPDGIDTMSRGIQPKFTNCDEDEQPATFQKWNDTAPAAPRRPPLLN